MEVVAKLPLVEHTLPRRQSQNPPLQKSSAIAA
jgi:hypothetical protein